MNVVIQPVEWLEGELTPPPSKSHTHRAVVCGSLSEYCEIKNALVSEDTSATMEAVEALGASIHMGGGGEIMIEGVHGVLSTPDDVIDAKNSGTTLRFMISLCSLAPGLSVLTGDHSLRKRPNAPLLSAMAQLGALTFSTKGDGTAPIIVFGGD